MQIRPKPRILIVDDEPGFLEKARRNIKKFEVVTALTIPDAVPHNLQWRNFTYCGRH